MTPISSPPLRGVLLTVCLTTAIAVVLGRSIAAAAQFVCVTTYNSQLVLVDTATNKIQANIEVGHFPIDVVVDPSGAFAYTINLDGNSVSVVDLLAGIVAKTIPTGLNATAAAISPDGALLYVGAGDLFVIDTVTRAVQSRIPSAGGNAVAVSPDGSTVFVAQRYANRIEIIETAALEIRATVAVGLSPLALVATPNGQRLYVANADSSTVSVVDTTTETVVETIPVADGVRDLAITPDGTAVYVLQGTGTSGLVSVIETATNTVRTTISMPLLDRPLRIAISPDGRFAYATNTSDRQGSFASAVAVIDLTTNTLATTIFAGLSPLAIATGANPQLEPTPRPTAPHRNVYVTNTGSNSLSIIDTSSQLLTSVVPSLRSLPSVLALSPTGDRAYVITAAPGLVYVIDTATHAVVRSIDVGGAPTAIALSPDGRFAFVAGGQSLNSAVSIIDTRTDEEAARIDLGLPGGAIAFRPDGAFAYVETNNGLKVIDARTRAIAATVPLAATPLGPRGMSMTSDGRLLYIGEQGSQVEVIDTTMAALVATIALPFQPYAVAVHPNGSVLYATDGIDSVFIIDTLTGAVTNHVVLPYCDSVFTCADRAIAFTPDGALAYVANYVTGTVSIIDTATESVVDTIFSGIGPSYVLVAPDVPSETPTAMPSPTSGRPGGGGGCAVDGAHSGNAAALFALAVVAALFCRQSTGAATRSRRR